MHGPPSSVSGTRSRLWSAGGVALAGLLTLSCGKDKPAPASAPGEGAQGTVGSSAGRFAGSEACRECHAAEFSAWSRSRHRATLRAWKTGEPLRLAGADLPESFRVGADGTVSGPGPDGHPLPGHVEFLIGGRRREEAFVRLADGRLQIFPVAYDVDAGRPFEPVRALAKGAAPPADSIEFWTRVGRNADVACYGCHATGQILVVAGRSPEGLALPTSRWSEPGVGCEGCHGPGGGHAASARKGKADVAELRMRTGATDTMDACALCHGLRDVLPSPFGSAPAHRYGETIVTAADPLLSIGSNIEFREPFFPDLRPATYQQEAIAFSQSGCALRGGLRCAACHDTHSGEPTTALAGSDGGDGICAPCHA
ncbi:MAG TPA: multiheme c-type cytochrome, partial [Candidatus Polarisedimenticolaceae bacterium]|nr:multiheme c-type cytochrome [Candidatus Polarisedimenticolaceae bacterium]